MIAKALENNSDGHGWNIGPGGANVNRYRGGCYDRRPLKPALQVRCQARGATRPVTKPWPIMAAAEWWSKRSIAYEPPSSSNVARRWRRQTGMMRPDRLSSQANRSRAAAVSRRERHSALCGCRIARERGLSLCSRRPCPHQRADVPPRRVIASVASKPGRAERWIASPRSRWRRLQGNRRIAGRP